MVSLSSFQFQVSHNTTYDTVSDIVASAISKLDTGIEKVKRIQLN